MKTEQITNLHLINSKYIVFKNHYDKFEPQITEPIITDKKIDPFLVDFHGSKLVIFTIQIIQTDQTIQTDQIDLLILQQINNKYYILYPDNFNLSNNYYVTGIYLVNIIMHRNLDLFDLSETEKDRLNLLYFEYHDNNKPIDIQFMESLLTSSSCQKCIMDLPSKSFDSYSIYHLIKHSKRRYSNNINIPASKYNNVKIYGIISDHGSHYSTMDISSYNRQFKNFNTNLVIEEINKDKIKELISKVIDDKKKGYEVFVITIADIFNEVCRYGEKAHDDMRLNLIILYSLCTVIPDIDMVMTIGSKKYVADPDFIKLMLPNTYVYPMPDGYNFNYDQQIKDLPSDYYIMKQGYSGSGHDVFTWSSFKGKYQFFTTRGYGIDTKRLEKSSGIEMYNDLQDKYHNRVERIKKRREDITFDERFDSVPCDEFFIIQPYSDLFKNCYEFKISVINDKIVCFYNGRSNLRNDEIQKYKNEKDELPAINSYIVEFINNVIAIVKRKWSNYVYLRIDIICECDGNNRYDILFSEKRDFHIYLNEIEHLGSGVKFDCTPVDKDIIESDIYFTESSDIIYDLIVDKFLDIIDDKIDNK